MANKTASLVLAFCFLLISQSNVLAQANPLTQPLTLLESNKISAQELELHTQALHDLYVQQIESYKFVEKDYQVAVNQQVKLGTLSSVEATLTAAKKAMVQRTDVLITYFNLLHDYVVVAQDMFPTDQTQISNMIIDHIHAYQDHLVLIAGINDRASLNLAADEFDLLIADSANISYRALFLLDYSSLNSLRLETIKIYQQIQSKQADLPLSEAKIAQRDRAYLDIESVLAKLSAEDEQQRELTFDPKRKNGLDIYRTGAKLLGNTQAYLIKTLKYLSELASVI